METKQYLGEISARLRRNFELSYDVMENDMFYDLKGVYHDVSGRIFITPQDIIDKMETFEYIYVKAFDRIGEEEVNGYFDRMCRIAANLEPPKDHFRSDVTGVMVCRKLPWELEGQVRNLKFIKNFQMLWRGWSEARLVLVELSTGKVFTNKPARDVKKVYSVKPSRFKELAAEKLKIEESGRV